MKEVNFKINDTLAKTVVELYLKNNNKVLLQKRFNTGYEDGKYGFIGGHLQYGETLKEAIIREAFEETGIILNEKDLTCAFIINKTLY